MPPPTKLTPSERQACSALSILFLDNADETDDTSNTTDTSNSANTTNSTTTSTSTTTTPTSPASTSTITSTIASQLRPLHFTIPELEHMLRYDVFPVVYTNLLHPAGEWAGFDEEWLWAMIEANRESRERGVGAVSISTLAWYTVGWMIQPGWARVKSALGARL